MRVSIQVAILVASASAALAGSCSLDSECVVYYSDGNCQNELGSYRPTCGGNCFQYQSYSSVNLFTDIGSGNQVDCTLYSDVNCQYELVNDAKSSQFGTCTTANGAQSMRCYYDC
jgi:hypothetical protein